MKGEDNRELRAGRKLPAQAGSGMMLAVIGDADSPDDRKGQLERIGKIEKFF